MKYKSQQERTLIPIRRKTKTIFDRGAKKANMKHIDFIDFLVNLAHKYYK